jgi:hypothetical protein
MRTQKTTKTNHAKNIAISLIDRSREEGLLLESWAASDSVNSMDSEWDEATDTFDLASFSGHSGHGFDS